MKTKIFSIILTIFLYIMLILTLLMLFSMTEFISMFSLIGRFHYGVLKNVFFAIWIAGIIVPVLFYKKMKSIWMLPLYMLLAIFVATTINYGVLDGVADYVSVYTREKWDKYPSVRYCMIDSLNEQYKFIGMTEQELKNVIGEPDRITEKDGNIIYKYVVGDEFTDPHEYNFVLKKGVIANASVSQQ